MAGGRVVRLFEACEELGKVGDRARGIAMPGAENPAVLIGHERVGRDPNRGVEICAGVGDLTALPAGGPAIDVGIGEVLVKLDRRRVTGDRVVPAIQAGEGQPAIVVGGVGVFVAANGLVGIGECELKLSAGDVQIRAEGITAVGLRVEANGFVRVAEGRIEPPLLLSEKRRDKWSVAAPGWSSIARS